MCRHQLVAFSLAGSPGLSDDKSDLEIDVAMRRKAPLRLLVSYLMVVLQGLVVRSVLLACYERTCVSSDTCISHQFCAAQLLPPEISELKPTGTRNCISCGWGTEILLGDTWSNRSLVQSICSNPESRYRARGQENVEECWRDGRCSDETLISSDQITAWCDVCVHTGGHADPTNDEGIRANNYAAMSSGDHATVALAAFTVALVVVQELKDILLVTIAVMNFKDAIEQKWRIALQFMNGMRRWIFLPCLVACIPTVIVLQGGDALSVCFNVSVLSCVNVCVAC